MIVRKANPSDANSVTAVLAAAYPRFLAGAYEDNILALALPMMVKASPTLLSSGQYFVVTTEDGLVIGCGGWTREAPGTNETRNGIAHLRHFATHPDYSRFGVGRMIYLQCVQQAQEQGIGVFECWSSLNAQQFYGALGFTIVGRSEIDMGGIVKFPVFVMTRSL